MQTLEKERGTEKRGVGEDICQRGKRVKENGGVDLTRQDPDRHGDVYESGRLLGDMVSSPSFVSNDHNHPVRDTLHNIYVPKELKSGLIRDTLSVVTGDE